jgi:hypothetical protein
MRSTIIFGAVLVMGGTLALTAASPQAEAYPKACLKFRNLDGLKKVDDHTFIASTKYGKDKYVVKMRGECHDLDDPDNYYTVRLYGDYECFDRDDILQFRYGGTCFIDSVTPVPPAPAN